MVNDSLGRKRSCHLRHAVFHAGRSYPIRILPRPSIPLSQDMLRLIVLSPIGWYKFRSSADMLSFPPSISRYSTTKWTKDDYLGSGVGQGVRCKEDLEGFQEGEFLTVTWLDR